jgi:Homeodomain
LFFIHQETKRPSKEMQVTIARQLGLEPTTVGNFFMNARRRSMDKWKEEDPKILQAGHLSPTSQQRLQDLQDDCDDPDMDDMDLGDADCESDLDLSDHQSTLMAAQMLQHHNQQQQQMHHQQQQQQQHRYNDCDNDDML